MTSDSTPEKLPDPTPTDLDQARAEIERLRRENEELRQRLGPMVADTTTQYQPQVVELPFEISPLPVVTNASPVQAKIGLFRALFRGREDVFATRWTSDRTGKSGYSPACEEPPWSLRKGQPRKYLPLTDQVIHDHLAGNKIIGIFPLLKGDAWSDLSAARTDADGRVRDFLNGAILNAGSYRLTFATGAWFAERSVETFFPTVAIEFRVTHAARHHHVPLLLSPFGYSTYRGS